VRVPRRLGKPAMPMLSTTLPTFDSPFYRRLVPPLAAFLLCLLAPFSSRLLHGAEVSVSAAVQPASTTVGEPVQLKITVNGAQKVSELPAVNIPGAQTQHIGASTQMRLVNTELSVSITHTYLVTPGRSGDLIIPSLEVVVEGRKYQTEPLRLPVAEPGQPAPAAPQAGPLAEIQLPKRPVYVGESFQSEVRLLVPSDQRWRIERMPEFETDAFTKTPFQSPQQRQESRDGKDFDACTFRSVLTAIKSGSVPLGPLTFNVQIAAPRKRNPQPNPFGNLLDGFPFDTQPTALQERKVILPEQRVEVKELPAEGKPSTFRGAIGRFRFSASANQTKVKAGEPVVLTLQMEGEGNFDRIEMPPLLQPEGWRLYPPEISFAKSDETGFRGVKTFRVALVPEKAHTQTPQFEFASFDPETGSYQTTKSSTSDLQIEGMKPAPPEPAPVPKPAPAPPKPAAAAESGLIESNFQVAVPSPLWSSRRLFLGVQAAIALLFGGWLLAGVLHKSRRDKGPSKSLLAEASSMEANLHAEADLSRFLRSAVRILQLRAAAKSGGQAVAVDADSAVHSFGVEGDLAAEIRWLFDSDAELQFAGSQHSGPVNGQVKTRVTALLKKLA